MLQYHGFISNPKADNFLIDQALNRVSTEGGAVTWKKIKFHYVHLELKFVINLLIWTFWKVFNFDETLACTWTIVFCIAWHSILHPILLQILNFFYWGFLKIQDICSLFYVQSFHKPALDTNSTKWSGWASFSVVHWKNPLRCTWCSCDWSILMWSMWLVQKLTMRKEILTR